MTATLFYIIAITALLFLGLTVNLVSLGKGRADMDTIIALTIQSVFVVYGLLLLSGAA